MRQIVDILTQPLLFPIAVAMAAGALAYLLSRFSPLACKFLAMAAGVCVLGGGVAIVPLIGAERFQWTWVERLTENVSLSVELAPTMLGMVVVIGSGAFAILISVYSFRAMSGHYWEGKFYAYLIWALGGACIVGLADNLLVLLVGWEIVTLMLFLMVNQGRRGAPAAGAKAYGMLGFADACLLLAVALLVGAGGSDALSLSGPARQLGAGALGATGYVVYVLIMIAALAKAGAVPVHTWIPSMAEDSPTPVMAYLPAAMDKLLGIYLLATLALRMFSPNWTMQVVMMVVGAVTIIAAVLMAMLQHNLKRLLAFHAVSQVGYMVLGIGTGTPIGIVGGLFHMINNAIYKSNLFLMSGTVGRAAGSDEIEEMGGLARHLPVTFVCGAISAAAISGIPPFNGFISKWLVYQGALQVSGANQALAVSLVVVAVFGSALTLASFVKVLYSAFLAPGPKSSPRLRGRPRESFFLVAPMVVLAAACVLLGLWPGLAVDYVLSPAVRGAEVQIVTGGGAIQTEIGIWGPGPALVLVLIGILLGMILVWVATWKQKVRVVRPFLAGEVPAAGDGRFRVPGTHFYKTISKLPLVGPLLAQGELGAMDPYHWSARHGNTFVQLLRRIHGGLISLYVSWVFVGLSIILIYLLLAART